MKKTIVTIFITLLAAGFAGVLFGKKIFVSQKHIPVAIDSGFINLPDGPKSFSAYYYYKVKTDTGIAYWALIYFPLKDSAGRVLKDSAGNAKMKPQFVPFSEKDVVNIGLK
jgi:hypothetical protein